MPLTGVPYNIYKTIILIVVIAWVLFACDDNICSNLNTSNVNISFFDSLTRNQRILIVDSITAFGTDSIFYKLDSASSYLLPVNTFSDSTVFLFFTAGNTDTITVRYNRTQSLISKDCGYTQAFDQLSVPYTSFPEAVIKSSVLLLSNDGDIEIYF